MLFLDPIQVTAYYLFDEDQFLFLKLLNVLQVLDHLSSELFLNFCL